MNTRISFLLAALLFGACCAVRCQDLPALPEPVLAVQRCFPQATVRLLPEVRFEGEIVTLGPVGWFSSISPDGRRLFLFQLPSSKDRVLQSYFLDLTTGELSLAKMLDQNPVKANWTDSFPYMSIGVWDPVEPAYLYAQIVDDGDS